MEIINSFIHRVRKYKVFTSILILLSSSFITLSFGQSKQSLQDSLVKVAIAYDYLNHKYKYLDSEYQIHISSHTFDSLAKAYNFYTDRIREYKDSLGVVLCGEFSSWPEVNLAHRRLTMSWLRISYILWTTPEKASELGSSYGFKMPYELYDFFYKSPEKWDIRMIEYVSDYRKKIYQETKNEDVKSMSYKKLFNYALVENPVRQKDYNELVKKQQGVGCKSSNCCQTPGNEGTSCSQ